MNAKYLFFDTETTGLPKKWKAPVTDSENWPRLVQLAWIVFDIDEKKIEERDCIVRPDGFVIPEAASKIHGIDTNKALEVGKDLKIVLDEFLASVESADVLVAHNVSFDETIIGAECYRLSLDNKLAFKKRLCTKESSTQFCKLPSRYGYKWPTLQELHVKLFGMDFLNAHNALADVEVCAKCFFELKRLGEIPNHIPAVT